MDKNAGRFLRAPITYKAADVICIVLLSWHFTHSKPECTMRLAHGKPLQKETLQAIKLQSFAWLIHSAHNEIKPSFFAFFSFFPFPLLYLFIYLLLKLEFIFSNLLTKFWCVKSVNGKNEQQILRIVNYGASIGSEFIVVVVSIGCSQHRFVFNTTDLTNTHSF